MLISKERIKILSAEANVVFGEPTAVRGDYSLAALLRAIVINRSEDDSPEHMADNSHVYVWSIDDESDVTYAMECDEYAISIGETKNGYFPKDYSAEGWVALDEAPYPVNKYLSQIVKTRIFVNSEKRRVVAFVERIAIEKWTQAFMSVLPRVLTWYFPSSLSDEENAFFKSISIGNKDVTAEQAEHNFIKYTDNAVEKIDLRTISLHKFLDGYEDTVKTRRIREYRNNISSISNDIENVKRNLANLYSRYEDTANALHAMEAVPQTGSTALYDFFNSHKCLSVIYTDEQNIRFGVTETIEYYDKDEFERVSENTSSYIHRSCKSPETLMALKAIFSEERGKFVTNAVFDLESMRLIEMVRFEQSDANTLPHPHIYFYGCGGGNDQYYSKYADSGDWELAIEQAIGAVKNLNFGDSTVVAKMIDWLEHHNSIPCIRMSDTGELVSLKHFIEIIQEGEQDNV